MVTNEMVLRAARTLIVAVNKISDETLSNKIACSCKRCATVSAVAVFFTGWLPVAGAGIACLVSAIAVWAMYVKINTAISVPFSTNLCKSILVAIGTNLLAYYVTILIANVIAFVPFLGSMASMVMMAVATYAVTLSSAYVYLNVLAKMFGKERELKPIDRAYVRQAASPLFNDADVRNVAKSMVENITTPL